MPWETKEIVTLSLGIWGAALSTLNFINSRRKDAADRREKAKAAKRDESKEIELRANQRAQLIIAIDGMFPSTKLFDQYAFEHQLFTRKPRLLEALSEIAKFWKGNEAAISRFFLRDSLEYRCLNGLYQVAQRNSDHIPKEENAWPWIDMHLMQPWKATQALENARNELIRQRDFPPR